MRDIKFKVWDNVDYMSQPFTLQDIQSKKIQFTSDCIVLQFTGLKDKNGKEIYEGDIVTATTKNPTIMKWENKGVVEYVAPSFAIYCGKDYLKDDEPKLYTWFQYNENFEVIGNVYENPRLIEINHITL